MPSLVYTFKNKTLTSYPYNNIYGFKQKSLTNFPHDFTKQFDYYLLNFRDINNKFVYINFNKEREQLISCNYNLGYKRQIINERILSQTNVNLLYKSSVKGKLSFTKHLDIELYAIPLMIELFDIQFTVDPPEIDTYDILIGGYLDTEDNYNPNSARGGVSGEDGFITSQSSPEIKYSTLAYNFKSAKKFEIPLTWGREAKPTYQKRDLRLLTPNWYYMIINKELSNEIYTMVNVKRIYVNYNFMDEFLEGLSESVKQNLSIHFKNGAILNDLREINLDFVDIDVHLYDVKFILNTDIINKRFDIENAKWVIVYYDESHSIDVYKSFWI